MDVTNEMLATKQKLDRINKIKAKYCAEALNMVMRNDGRVYLRIKRGGVWLSKYVCNNDLAMVTNDVIEVRGEKYLKKKLDELQYYRTVMNRLQEFIN